MSDPATINRAARLVALITARDPADAVLRRELTPRRDLAPDRRRDIARAVAVYFRWLGWLDPADPPQVRVAAALALQARFDANAAALKPEALAARAVPGWIWNEIDFPVESPSETADPADRAAPWLRQLQRDPPLWIRIRREFAAALPRQMGDCDRATVAGLGEPGPGSATPATTAFRYTGPRDLFLTDEFRDGRFEIQDLASQLVGLACAPQPGETWWDACAGEGGKTLHLADLMQNRGLIWASDRSARRLEVLRKRAARARVFNYRAVFWNGQATPPTRTRFDGVLVDAPCSGVGTWQRHPHARWTATPNAVRELAVRQSQLLDHVAGSVKPGGRLVYSVCTLTRAETTAIATAFARAHPDFEPAPVFAGIAARSKPAENQIVSPPSAVLNPLAPSLALWPQDLNANGMFIAAWRRKP